MAEATKRSPLFTEAPQGILVLDREGYVLDANPAGCRTLGRPRDRLVERPFVDWVLPRDKSRTEDAIQMVVVGQALTWQARLRRGDGLPRIHELKGCPLGRGDSVEGVLVFLRDYSERGEGRPVTRQLQTLLENLPNQFTVVTDKHGRIRHSSGLGRTHFRDNGSVLGSHYRELLGKEREGEENFRSLFQTVCSGESWAGVQWHRRKDGVSFPAEVYASPHLDPTKGQVVGVMVVGRDLSSNRKWQDLAESLRPLARIGALAGRIAEEIQGGLARIERGIREAGTTNGNGSSSLPEAQVEVSRLRRFLTGIEEFGETRRARPERLEMAGIVHKALEDVSGRMNALGVQPMVEVPPNLPAAFADPPLMERVLQILLDNALEAVSGSPIPLLRLELHNGPDGVILKIMNSGSSVQKDWLEEVFDPFVSTKEGRSGLGLAVAKGLVELQSGRIWAEIPQEGFLTLSVELPREAPDRVREFRPAPLNLSRSRTILVVDDDEAIRSSLRSFLEKVGFNVKEAWSGRSALAQLTSGRLPEIVLTDLKMSDGNGYWFLDELEREFPGLVGRTVILTGDADHERAHELSAETGCPLVRKPFELPHLLEVLDRVALSN
jgi:PAS domain S-box-containing protein